jgi:transcriptional regulator with XRE-family HTH domain
MNDSSQRPGARFNTWLAHAATPLRERAGRRREEIAVLADVGIDQVRRFERGDTNAPRHLERIIAAYAHVGETTTVEIYARAVDLWREHGTEPALAPDRLATARPEAPGDLMPPLPSRADSETGAEGA